MLLVLHLDTCTERKSNPSIVAVKANQETNPKHVLTKNCEIEALDNKLLTIVSYLTNFNL